MRATQTTSDIDSVRSRCSALSDLSSTAFAVLRLSSFTMTSPSFVFTTTRSPLCTVAPGDTMMTSPARYAGFIESPEISNAYACSSVTAGKAISSQPLPTGKPPSSKKPPAPACANPINGTFCMAALPPSVISVTKVSNLVPVACNDLATDSVDGHRCRPSAVTRLDLLNVVGSRPAFLASPDGDSLARAASRSIAVQIWLWVSMAISAGTTVLCYDQLGIITLSRPRGETVASAALNKPRTMPIGLARVEAWSGIL